MLSCRVGLAFARSTPTIELRRKHKRVKQNMGNAQGRTRLAGTEQEGHISRVLHTLRAPLSEPPWTFSPHT